MDIYKQIGVQNRFSINNIDYELILIMISSLKKEKKHVQSNLEKVEIIKEESNDIKTRKDCIEQILFFKSTIDKINNSISILDSI